MLCLLPCPSLKQPGGHGSAKTGLEHWRYLEDENLMAAASSRAWRGPSPWKIQHGDEAPTRAPAMGAFRGWAHPSPGAQLLSVDLRAASPGSV